jgi:hypothetical protein
VSATQPIGPKRQTPTEQERRSETEPVRRSHGMGGGGEAELAQAVGLAREHGGFQYVLQEGKLVW